MDFSMKPKTSIALVVYLGLQAVALHGMASASAERVAVWEWSGVSRVVAVGDVHGSYEKLVRLLKGADLVDEELRWVGAESHLVVAGDLLDRGPGDRSLMDLLRRLQEESEAAGGRVHVLLGNHEAMNLLRDLRYVHWSSYLDFSAEEEKGERRRGWVEFSRARVGGTSQSRLMHTFNKKFPRGFFGRLKAFDPEGEYGSWLLDQPAIVKINDVVYVHGGLAEEFATLGIDAINRRVGDDLRRHLELREVLENEGVITPVMYYQDIIAATKEALERRRLSAPVRETAEQFLEIVRSDVLGGRGPLWYRGNSWEDERIERGIIEQSLERVGAKAMVVAHSYTGGSRITSRFHGQVFRVDNGIVGSDRPLALVVERGEALVLDPLTKKLTKPVRELPPGVNGASGVLVASDPELKEFLSKGEVVDSRYLGRGSTRPRLVVLEKNGEQRRGVFKTVESEGDPSTDQTADRYEHEVAAYRLDRRLGLHLVPVTVLRELDGQRGSLQTWVEGAVDQEAAESYELDLYKTEITARQLAHGEIFDALIGNHDRRASDVLCLVNGEQVFFIDHSQAFSLSADLGWKEGQVLSLEPRLAEALSSLDRESLEKDLGELISDRQIEALLERRDKILAAAKVATAESPSATELEGQEVQQP
jgi:hypothetical protein